MTSEHFIDGYFDGFYHSANRSGALYAAEYGLDGNALYKEGYHAGVEQAATERCYEEYENEKYSII